VRTDEKISIKKFKQKQQLREIIKKKRKKVFNLKKKKHAILFIMQVNAKMSCDV